MDRLPKNNLRDFLHHLHDTLILLGAEKNVADLVNNSETINDADVNSLRRYNGKLIDATKDKLVNINKITVDVKG